MAPPQIRSPVGRPPVALGWMLSGAFGLALACSVMAVVVGDGYLCSSPWPSDNERSLWVYGLKHLGLGAALGWLLLAEGGWVGVTRTRYPQHPLTADTASAARSRGWTAAVARIVSGVLLALVATLACPVSLTREAWDEDTQGALVFLSLPALMLSAAAVGGTLRRVRGRLTAWTLVIGGLGVVAVGPLAGSRLIPWLEGVGAEETEFMAVFVLGQSIPLGLALLGSLAVWWWVTGPPPGIPA